MELISGEKLKSYRTLRKLTLEQVATATKRTKSYVSRIETGSAALNIEMLAKLKEVLNIPDEEFSPEVLNELKSGYVIPVVNTEIKKVVVDLSVIEENTVCLYNGQVVDQKIIVEFLKTLNQNDRK